MNDLDISDIYSEEIQIFDFLSESITFEKCLKSSELAKLLLNASTNCLA